MYKGYWLVLIFALLLIQINVFSQEKDKKEPIHVFTNNLSMVFTISENGKVIHHYFGNKMENVNGFLTTKYTGRPDTQQDFAPEIYPAYGGRHYIEPALQVNYHDGVMTTELIYSHHFTSSEDDNTSETIIVLKDKIYPLTVEVHMVAYQKEDIISKYVKIINSGNNTVELKRFYSSYLPLHRGSYYLTHFHGTWANEMQMVEEKILPGVKRIESKKGLKTTQSENPYFLVSIDKPASEDSGQIYGACLAWSGNYSLSFELDEAGVLNILGGINPFLSEYKLAGGRCFSTPEMILTYSDCGKGQISRNFHDWTRRYSLMHGYELKPIVLNSWEGAYFDFNEQTIIEMIDKAAEFGVEMFVLDDGWFGNKYPRNGDNAGLGDWKTNKKKLPRGIDFLASYANSKGVKFGIWIEPEMVNPDSELAKKHPEWLVKSGTREIMPMRNQWLLDLSNPEVQDFIVQTFDNVVSMSPYISYVKWDANRHVDNVGSSYLPVDKQSHFWIEYTKGLYSIYNRIRVKYPDVMIQLCSAGGGRVDHGALKYHDEFWASDNTDPLSRIFIQYGYSMFYPANAVGSHVSTSPNHQTGSITPLKFRFDVAMSGRLGLELQPKDLQGDEIVFAKEAIKNYKTIRPIVQLGDLFRLISPYEENGWAANMYVTKNKSQAVFFAYSLKYHNRTMSFKPRMSGLDTNKKYRLTELNRKWGAVIDEGTIYTGEYLINVGLNLNIKAPYESVIILLEEI